MSGAERLTASEAAARLAAGTLTAETLIRDCLDRVRARAEVKAWVWLDPDQALAQARAVDRAGRPSLLAGVPVGIKDVIDTVDMPTEHGSPIYRGNRPFADAACVALIRAAGGVILLSPAAPSYDHFRNFEERGERFRELSGARPG